MTKKTRLAQPAPAEEMPNRGGSFVRKPDGALDRVEGTRNHDDDDDGGDGGDDGGATSPADPPLEPETATEPATAPAAIGEAD